jgi:hypothetical protein
MCCASRSCHLARCRQTVTRGEALHLGSVEYGCCSWLCWLQTHTAMRGKGCCCCMCWLVEVRDNVLRFPLMPPGPLQTDCDEG